jgi:uncharacterized protein YhaN
VPKFVSALVAELARALECKRQAEVFQEKIKRSGERIERLQVQIDQRQAEIDGLLAAAGAADEEAFRRRAADYDARRNLDGDIRRLETHLRQLAGSGDAIVALEGELGRVTPEALTSERSRLEETIRIKDEDQKGAIDQRGQLRQQLNQLESSEELSRLRLEEQAVRAEVQSCAEEWAVLRIAAHLIDKAREKYERERRPTVLKEAERYFSHFTRGNYTEIRIPAGDDRILLLAPGGTTKDAGQLSRGTAEQLYLALRFGFVREFVRRSESLPLVFDDILVNFDPGRARATAEAIRDLSKSLQILFFTCHPATVKLLREVDNSATVYALEDNRVGCVPRISPT